jgi:hypothetical protein
MQTMWLVLCTYASAVTISVSPIEKVLQLLGDLQAKVIKEGEGQQQIYEEFTDWCKDTAKETQFELKTERSAKERFAAAEEDATSTVTELTTKIEELTSAISEKEATLKKATALRKKEHADFLDADKELGETISMLRRALAILQKEMGKGALLQTAAMAKVADSLGALVEASSLNTLDKTKLQVLLEAGEDDSQPEEKGQSKGIIDTMEDMLEKSEEQQSAGQKAEMEAAHHFDMLKLSLEDGIKAETKELAESKKEKAMAEEKNAEAAGNLERSKKEIAADEVKLKDLQHECMSKAQEFEAAQIERNNELEALAAAKKILQEKTGGAADRTYSFVQVAAQSKMTAKAKGSRDRIVSMLQDLAKSNAQPSLAQLAEAVRSTMLTENDPFAKVKGMIQEMLEKLLKEAKEEADKKAFCDKEMKDTKMKMDEKESEVEDLTTALDTSDAKIAKLKQGIAVLEGELGKIASEQKTATDMRNKEKTEWEAAKGDFEQGLEGVQMALEVLRDYYAKKDDSADALLQSDIGSQMSLAQTTVQSGGAGGIIGMLEVAEADFSKMLAEGQADEDQAQKEYDKFTEDNKIAQAAKETEVKYKQKDMKETQASGEETSKDLGVAQEEQSAVLEYDEKLKPQCVSTPDPYEERVKRREKEVAGLKEALQILEAESAPAFLSVRRA